MKVFYSSLGLIVDKFLHIINLSGGWGDDEKFYFTNTTTNFFISQ